MTDKKNKENMTSKNTNTDVVTTVPDETLGAVMEQEAHNQKPLEAEGNAKPADTPITEHPIEEKPHYTHEQLRDALYWAQLLFERASIGMVLIKDTGLAVHKMRDLTGDGIHVAARKLEWESSSRGVIDSMAQYAEWTDELVTYVAENGVPVFVHVLHDDYCISSPDTKLYEHENFKLPNPFERFEEVYGKDV